MPGDPTKMLAEIEALKESLKGASGKEKARLFEKMGDVYADAEKVNKAEICYKQAMEAGATGTTITRKYAEALTFTGQTIKATQVLDAALANTTERLDKALLYIQRAKLKINVAEYEEGRKSGELAIEILEKDYSKGRALMDAYADANNIAGLCLWELGRCEQALKRLDTSAKTYASFNDDKGVGKARANKGLVLYQLGRFDEAMELYEEAIKLDEKTGGTFNRGHCQNNLGLIRLAQGDLDEAERCFQDGNKSYSKHGYTRGLHMTELNLMDLYIEKGDMIRASMWAERALKGFQGLK